MKPETKKAAKARIIAEKRQAKEAARFKFLAEVFAHPVGVVIAPLKGEAIVRATKDAKALVERIRAKLEENGWDINKVAPYPASRNLSQLEYMVAIERYRLYNSVTRWRNGGSRRPDEPILLVDMDKEMIADFIEKAKKHAEEQFTEFVIKLVKKIGPCQTATLDGNYVWSFSILTVVLPDGTTQKWKTQQIWNVSCLGKEFPQWPSRIIK
jgi:hypothetical protein